MKILVTGANGYLGRGVVDELLKRGNEVIATDFACDHVNSAAHCVPGDIFSIEDPYTYFGEPDGVMVLYTIRMRTLRICLSMLHS